MVLRGYCLSLNCKKKRKRSFCLSSCCCSYIIMPLMTFPSMPSCDHVSLWRCTCEYREGGSIWKIAILRPNLLRIYRSNAPLLWFSASLPCPRRQAVAPALKSSSPSMSMGISNPSELFIRPSIVFYLKTENLATLSIPVDEATY